MGVDLTTAQGPLVGLKVLDLSIVAAGGAASRLLDEMAQRGTI